MSSTGRPVVSITMASSASRERRVLAALVEGVALGDRGRDLLVGQVDDLLVPALGPHLGRRGEEQLQLGVGEHDRADVAPLDDAAAVLAAPTRPGGCAARRAPRGWPPRCSRPGSPRGRGSRGWRPARRRARRSTPTSSSSSRAEPGDPVDVVGVDVAPEGREGHAAVHRAGVEVVAGRAARPVPWPRSTSRPRRGRRWRSRSSLASGPHPASPADASPSTRSAKPGKRLGRRGDVFDLDAGHDQAEHGAPRWPGGGRRRCGTRRRGARAGRMPSPSSVSPTSPPSARELARRGRRAGRSRGRAGGRCPAGCDGVSARAATRGQHGRQLADVVEVGVQAVHRAEAAHREPARRRGRRPRPSRPAGGGARSPGWVVPWGQPGTVTRPPVTSAAARNGAAFDRSGSITHVRRLDHARAHRPRGRASASSTSTPAWRSMATVMSMWGYDGTGGPSCSTVMPRVARGPDQQQRAHELRRRRGVDRDRRRRRARP